MIAFGGRVLGAGEPKYLNSPETPLFEKGREVFGRRRHASPCARRTRRSLSKAIWTSSRWPSTASATRWRRWGRRRRRRTQQKLLRQVDRIVYCFEATTRGARRRGARSRTASDALPEQKSIGFVFLPEAEDPDSYVRAHGHEAFERLIAQAMPLSEFLLRELAQQCDMTSAEGRAKLVADAKPLLARLQTPLLRLQLVKRLAEASGFSQSEVERLCDLQPIVRGRAGEGAKAGAVVVAALVAFVAAEAGVGRRRAARSIGAQFGRGAGGRHVVPDDPGGRRTGAAVRRLARALAWQRG